MSAITDQEKVETLLAIMANAPEFAPDFAAAAKDLGATAATVKSRFKSVVDADKRYKVESTKGCKATTKIVKVANDADDDAPEKVSTPPRTPRTPRATTSKKRGRKDDEVNEAPKSPTKKSPTKKARKVKSEPTVEDETTDAEKVTEKSVKEEAVSGNEAASDAEPSSAVEGAGKEEFKKPVKAEPAANDNDGADAEEEEV